ncbi:MAG TPA: caspase family protein [Waterburya sp.]|jgi:hypothetical protein
MSSIKRRKFLQFMSASALTTLSLGQFNREQTEARNAQVFAQSPPRKLALLVGINTYPDRNRFTALKGCLTDVELQRQLLIHRFGFNPIDILTLTEAQATRQGILAAFEEHLIKPAQPGDVVVFHFSGYSSQVADPECDVPDCLNSTLVPVDSTLQPDGSVLDITRHTLWLLLAALKTENVTVVIDARRGANVINHSRSCSTSRLTTDQLRCGNPPQMSIQEKVYQQQWLSRLALSPSAFRVQRQTGIAKGMWLSASQQGQLAAEAVFSDVCAGTFTYLMTQYLWQQTGNEPARSAIANITRGVTSLFASAQLPQLLVKPNSRDEEHPIYFLTRQTPPAEAVITQIEGENVKVWLGGVEPQSLQAFTRGGILTIVDGAGKEQGLVQLKSRIGLVGMGKLLQASQAVQAGTLLQERIRGIPNNLTLRLGLDFSLGNYLSEVQSALHRVKFIEVLPLDQQIDYILGRITAGDREAVQPFKGARLPCVGSIGLFLPAGVPVPNTFGESDETLTAAVSRLQPKFKSLLATRLVKLALNPNSSRLNLKAWMTPEENPQGVLAEAFSVRGSSQPSVPEHSLNSRVGTSGTAPVLPIRTHVQLHIVNNEPRTLYCSILVLDANREISVIFPNQWAAAEDVTQLEAGQTLLVPNPSKDAFILVTEEPKGVAEVLIIASSKPLQKTLLSLRAIAQRGGQRGGPLALSVPEDSTVVVTNLLDDLDRGVSTTNQEIYSLDTTQLAVMSIPFEVV